MYGTMAYVYKPSARKDVKGWEVLGKNKSVPKAHWLLREAESRKSGFNERRCFLK